MIEEARAATVAAGETVKSPWSYPIITYLWVGAVAVFGGLVSWINKRKEGVVRPYNIVELIGETVTAAFTGVITFWLCEQADVPPLLSAVFIAVAGHMGARALFVLEKWAEKRLPFGGEK